ncbi:hypothetical protein HPP92_022608 [Vanilla planifolia]|uniref:Uncharacterized protein n=1 Tax=Vanilla planifolia TaxID=51239 RepID=A0A835UFH2_VANPL|nr:hypothetical protein HPP92_022608 [Vanilla planifolia]
MPLEAASFRTNLVRDYGKKGMNLTLSDHAIQLDLVAKARGISDAEEYFMNLQESAKKPPNVWHPA